MNQELQREATFQEVQFPDACIGCGGPVAARFTPGAALGVCLTCRIITGLAISRAGNGVRVVQLPQGLA